MIGFACKFHPSASVNDSILKATQTKSTTATWIRDQISAGNKHLAVEKVRECVYSNIAALAATLVYLKTLPDDLRMYRMSLDLFPFISHPEYFNIYDDETFMEYIKSRLLQLGKYARQHGIKLSMHPGQYTVLNSDKPDVCTAAIAEIEAHTFVARCMGYGDKKYEFKINVHLNGNGGKRALQSSLKKLSMYARQFLTVENDEFSCGLDEILELAEEFHLAVVLDIHHHWIHTGEYINARDPRISRIIATWQEARPTMHYSYSSEEELSVCSDAQIFDLPNRKKLIENGATLSGLRKHSNGFPNITANSWALSFADKFDIMCEAKNKNLAAEQLYRLWKTQEITYGNHET